MYKMTKEEQETIITFNEVESMAEIETYSRRLKTKLETIAYKYPQSVKLISSDENGCAHYHVRKNIVTIATPYSEERREISRTKSILALMKP